MSVTPRNKSGRPGGTYHVITDELVECLTRLLETHSEEEVAAALSETVGHPVDRSSINNVLTRRYPSSRLAHPLAVLYGWPIPPVARSNRELAEIQAMLDELGRIDPDKARHVRVIIESELDIARAKRALEQKKTPQK